MFVKYESGLLVLIVLAWMSVPAETQSSRPNLEGRWGDPPSTAVGTFCFFACTDAGIDHLNALLDNPANSRGLHAAAGQLSAGRRWPSSASRPS